MDRCDEDVIIAFGFYLLSEEKKRKKKENTGFIRCSEQDKGKESFTLFGRLKNDRQKIFKYFRMSFSKFENVNRCCTQSLKRRIHDGDGA